MLQDLHTATPLPTSDPDDTPHPDTQPRSPAAPPFSANTYAERLMDELFEDVEQLLHLESTSPATPTAAVAPAADAEAQPFPETEVRAELDPAMPLATRSDAIALQPTADLLTPPLAAITPDLLPPPTPTPAPTTPPQRAWERFLLAVGCVSIVVTLGLWWLYQTQQQRQLAGIAPVGAGTTASLADQKFANYLQKSLQHVSPQPTAAAGGAATPGNAVTVPGMPNVVIPPTAGTAPAATNSAGTGSERVYVPVYQLPSNLYPPGTAVKPLPNLPSAGKPAPSVGSTQAANSNPTGVVRRLVGVLEQGNGSVALFEINGVTQRYELGESIGSSGWTLVEVSKNQAIIRRNGDVRSLFVGHSF